MFHLYYTENMYPAMKFAEAKQYFEKAFLNYYGQAVQEISEENSLYINGAWIFNSPAWTSDGKTVTNYGYFRDRKNQKYQPYGSQFNTIANNIPIYPG